MFSARITWLKAIKEALCVLTMGTNAHCTMEHIFGVIGTCMGTNEYSTNGTNFVHMQGNIIHCTMEHIFGVIGTCMGSIVQYNETHFWGYWHMHG